MKLEDIKYIKPKYIAEGILNIVSILPEPGIEKLKERYIIMVDENENLSKKTKLKIAREIGDLLLRKGSFEGAKDFYSLAKDFGAIKEISYFKE